MRTFVKSFKAYPALSVAGALVFGLREFVALQRSQAQNRRKLQA